MLTTERSWLILRLPIGREAFLKILVTGGCGFIGSNFIKVVLRERRDWHVVNVDALTYAGNLENLEGVAEAFPNYTFAKVSIAERSSVDCVLHPEGPKFDAIVNFAAESHVDRSIMGCEEFVRTNVQGTAVLLEAAKRCGVGRFLQVSTDEVYGSLPPEGRFVETTPLHPNNPYAATKAAADHLALAYAHTFGMDVVITRSSNNYGPHQFPEKFIPLFVSNALEGKECPLYGDGAQVRDWLHVEDNCRGILAALEKGKRGGIYNLGGGNELPNRFVAGRILHLIGAPQALIKFVKDRPGHDVRYAIDFTKARLELGWNPVIPFEAGLEDTVNWYSRNALGWVARVKTGEYRRYYERQYGR